MPPKPKTPVPAALHPHVQMSSGSSSELHKRQDSTSLKQGKKKRRKTKASSANTTATSPVSLASDVGHVGTQGAKRKGNLLLCSTALTYLQDFFQVVKSKYEATGAENLKQSFSSCLQLRCCHHFIGTSYCLKSCMLATLATSFSNLPCTC